jgi:hypothetical protein
MKADEAVHTADSFNAQGLVVLTASDSTQYAYEGEVVHGSVEPSRFTAVLVEGLSSGAADLDGDGHITVENAYDFVRRRLSEEGVPQNPKKWEFDVTGHIELAFTAPSRPSRRPSRRPALPRTDAAVLDRHYALVAELLAQGEVVPILGDEVNLSGRPDGAAWEPTSRFPPIDEELAAYLAHRYEYDDQDAQDLPSVAEYMLDELGEASLYGAMRTVLDAEYEPSPVYDLLARLPAILRRESREPPLFITMNYDRALEQALEATGEPFDLLAYDRGRGPLGGHFVHHSSDGDPTVIDRPYEYEGLFRNGRAVVLKLRGMLDGTSPPLVSGHDLLDFLPAGVQRLPFTVLERISDAHVLFLGLRVGHQAIQRFLSDIWHGQVLDLLSWSVLTDPERGDVRFWERRNVEALNLDLDDYVETLAEHFDALPPRTVV